MMGAMVVLTIEAAVTTLLRTRVRVSVPSRLSSAVEFSTVYQQCTRSGSYCTVVRTLAVVSLRVVGSVHLLRVALSGGL